EWLEGLVFANTLIVNRINCCSGGKKQLLYRFNRFNCIQHIHSTTDINIRSFKRMLIAIRYKMYGGQVHYFIWLNLFECFQYFLPVSDIDFEKPVIRN